MGAPLGTLPPEWARTPRPADAGPYDCPMGWSFTWTDWNRYRRRWDGCAFCGGKQETLLAVVAWRWGGGRDIGNAMPSCKRCRKEKGSRYMVVWMRSRAVYADAQNLTPAAFAVKYHLESTREAFLAQRRVRRVQKLAQLRAPLPMTHEAPEPDTATLKVQMVVLQRRATVSAADRRRRNGL